MGEKIKSNIVWVKNLILSNRALKCLLVLGIFLRLKHYLENRSLWTDEAHVALDISRRTLEQVFYNLHNVQDFARPPVGFSMLIKSTTLLLGNNELAFRLWPFICAVLSLILFYHIVKRCVAPKTAFICIGLFVFSGPLIYYSAELKHYSCDVLITCILYWYFDLLHRNDYKNNLILTLGILGAIVMWFSYVALLVLAGIGCIIFINICKKKDLYKFLMIILMCILWLFSFLVLYDTSINSMLNSNSLVGMWEKAFIPTDQGVGKGLLWISASLFDMFKPTLGLSLPSATMGTFLFGCYSMFKRNQTRFFYLILPVMITLLMAIIGKYPFYGRLILFISPCLAIMIGEGVVFISKKIPKYTSIISVILITILFYSPISLAGQKVVKGHATEEMRPVMEYFSQHYKEGDFIYFSNSAQYAFGYYHGQFDFSHKPVDMGNIADLIGYDGEIFGVKIYYSRYFFTKQGYFSGFMAPNGKDDGVEISFKDGLKGFRKEKRSWFIFTHMRKNQKDGLLAFLGNNATKLQEYKAIGSSIYLYDLSGGGR